MRIQTRCRGLLLALIALASFLPPAVWAVAVDWCDASLTTTVSSKFYNRISKKNLSYVTVKNETDETLGGPFRLVITDSNFTVANADGATDEGKPYIDFPETTTSLEPGQQEIILVEFTPQRGQLAFTTQPQYDCTVTAQIELETTAVEGAQVTMTGIANGPDGTVSYAWTQTAGPSVGVTGSTDQTLTFEAPSNLTAPVALTFELAATDEVPTTATATASIVIQPDDIYVTAGEDRTAYPGDVVSLHGYGYGSGSSPSFSWSQIGGPKVQLSSDNPNCPNPSSCPNPTFIAPAVIDQFAPAPTLTFRLTFTDGIKTAYSDVNIKIKDTPRR